MSVMVMAAAMIVAVTMIMVVHVINAFYIAPARHHEDMAVSAHDLYVRAEEPRKNRRLHNLVDRPEHGLPVAEVEHAVKCSQQLVKLMRAEQDRDLALAAYRAHHIDRDFLIACVETDQWLIEQQQHRIAHERLRQQEPLPLPTGHFRERPCGKFARADGFERRFDSNTLLATE